MISIRNLIKVYAGTKALNDVSIEIKEGEVLGLLGQNGAGKSTLIKILSGDVQQDSGDIYIDQRKVTMTNPKDSLNNGISVVYQESQLIQGMTAYENIMLGREKVNRFGLVNFHNMYEFVKEKTEELGFDLPLKKYVSQLSTAQQRIVEIVKAFTFRPKIMILDEPTASLTREEAVQLSQIVKQIKQSGVAVIFVSHRLEEVSDITDKVSILRNGELVGTYQTRELSHDQMAQYMIGDKSIIDENQKNKKDEKDINEIDNSSISFKMKGELSNKLKNIDLKIHRGEIVGIAGNLGSGRSTLLRAIFGCFGKVEFQLEGKNKKIYSPTDAIRSGVVYVPEDRKKEGLYLKWDIANNISFPKLKDHSPLFVSSKWEKDLAWNSINDLQIKTSGVNQTIRELSGGNQQKVLLGKWINMPLKLLMLDEPTHGVDVNAKKEIIRFIHNMAKTGVMVIIVSSDLEELIEMSDKILMINRNEFIGEVKKHEFNHESILAKIAK